MKGIRPPVEEVSMSDVFSLSEEMAFLVFQG